MTYDSKSIVTENLQALKKPETTIEKENMAVYKQVTFTEAREGHYIHAYR
mgnify:CR=1 FL=1